ncbi:MAG: hypothetical protein E6H06_04275 [Bacteroidetes bacterium]|nr:MAG: hypothetical protein E6H06_04275 [Bacteroidota bacterium]
MKNLSLLILLVISFVLFLIGISIPGRGRPIHIIFVTVAVTLGFIFYLLTFLQVIKTPTLSSGRRIFWIVAIVCVPMIGNLVYIIIHDADIRKQVPKPEV